MAKTFKISQLIIDNENIYDKPDKIPEEYKNKPIREVHTIKGTRYLTWIGEKNIESIATF